MSGDIITCKQYIGGNFVDYHLEKGFVEFKNGEFGVHRKQGYYQSLKKFIEYDYELEVISNIYDNPELLGRRIDMYKIRDDVDLKELEKFGYTKIDIGLTEQYEIYAKYIEPYFIEIRPDGNIVANNDNTNAILKEEYIQDLIQANLVVKE